MLSGAVGDRLAGLEEICIARRVGAILAPRIQAAEREEHQLRQEFLERCTERRQTETLVEAAQQREAREETRRAQQKVDEQHLGRLERFGRRAIASVHSSTSPPGTSRRTSACTGVVVISSAVNAAPDISIEALLCCA